MDNRRKPLIPYRNLCAGWLTKINVIETETNLLLRYGQGSDLDDDELDEDERNAFVPSLGAWSKPLHFTPPPTLPEPATPRLGVSEAVKCQIASFWSSISESIVNGPKTKKGQKSFPTQAKPQLPVNTIPPPALKDDGSLRFPWAARMNQSSRNLFRATEPTYRLDGTPKVTIPSKVLRLGPENNEEYVVGQFHRCSSPPGGLVHAVLNRLWGRECRITCKKLGDSSFLFHIPHENTRKRVIQRGVLHVDDCLLFVAPWSPVSSFKIPEISTLPVWVNLKNIPDSYFSRLRISHITSGLGEPMLTQKPRLDPTNMGEAKILVEVELDKPFPKLIPLDDKQGNIYLVEVEYTWIPSSCERCDGLGHKEKRCLLPPLPHDSAPVTKESQVTYEDIPIVDIVHLMENSSKTHVEHVEPNSRSHTTHQSLETSKKSLVTLSSEDASTSPVTHSHEVHFSSSSQIDNTLPILAAEKSAPTQSLIMEDIPSQSIILEDSRASETEQQIVPRSPLTLDHHRLSMEPETPLAYGKGTGFDVVGDSSSYTVTRGGRKIKPTQKVQEMGWTNVSGRGKRSRRGRGNHNH
ncbi:hypothetical protein Bca101_044166 [Brassica carinata]